MTKIRLVTLCETIKYIYRFCSGFAQVLFNYCAKLGFGIHKTDLDSASGQPKANQGPTWD